MALKYLLLEEVSKILDMDEAEVKEKCDEGEIPCEVERGEYFIPREPFFRWHAGGLI